jgi:hypothetical protein
MEKSSDTEEEVVAEDVRAGVTTFLAEESFGPYGASGRRRRPLAETGNLRKAFDERFTVNLRGADTDTQVDSGKENRTPVAANWQARPCSATAPFVHPVAKSDDNLRDLILGMRAEKRTSFADNQKLQDEHHLLLKNVQT